MILLNYGHPLTPEQLAQTTELLGKVPAVRDIAVQIDRNQPIAEAARDLADAVGFAPAEWQTRPMIVNPPGLAPLALGLIAEIHGRCGHFPAILNIRPTLDALPPRYEVAEIVNLQALRDMARSQR